MQREEGCGEEVFFAGWLLETAADAPVVVFLFSGAVVLVVTKCGCTCMLIYQQVLPAQTHLLEHSCSCTMLFSRTACLD
jgi:hypothetical protein